MERTSNMDWDDNAMRGLVAVSRTSRNDLQIMLSSVDNPTPLHVTRQIELRGVRVHNLKSIDLDIPLRQFVILSGVSGSGKSSLAFDTIFAEGQRRYIESFSAAARQYLERIERPDADRIAHVPPPVAIRTDAAVRSHDSTGHVAAIAEIELGLKRLFARGGRVFCPDCRCEVHAHSVADVLRIVAGIEAERRIQFCFAPTGEDGTDSRSWLSRGFSRAISGGKTLSLNELPSEGVAPPDWIVVDRVVTGKATPERIAESAEAALREGNGRIALLLEQQSGSAPPVAVGMKVVPVDGRDYFVLRFSQHWECPQCQRALLPPSVNLFDPDFGGGCLQCRGGDSTGCTVCQGTRLSAAALAVQIDGRTFADLLSMTVDEALGFCRSLLQLAGELRNESHTVLEEIERRLRTVVELGLGHLVLQRTGRTLSAGQIRRLLLAATIGSRITGTLCLIDEPSAGLHTTEIPSVIRAIRQLVGQGNSVIVVDHSSMMMDAADYLIELGPGAGPQGGRIAFAGLPKERETISDPATGIALRAAPQSAVNPRTHRIPSEWITLKGIHYRNLNQLTVRVPVGVLCVVSGRSGSGKTSLVMDLLVPLLRHRLGQGDGNTASSFVESLEGGDQLTEVAIVDQTPLTRSSRSNAATWIEVFDEIRDVFAMTAEAKLRGFGPQHFSFNAPQGGRCRACRGAGVLRHNMQFLPDVSLACPECGGTRFRREILEVRYRGRSIADVLAMSAAEAAIFFRNHPRLQSRLQMLKQIGLDYLVLGQATETLSGGEAQRLRLAARLTSSRGRTLIVCDEATVGLHPADISRLISCFDELLGIGHSIVVIDNSPELLRAADHVIELGTVAANHMA